MLFRTGLGGQMSGSVGGVTASHNRAGQYLRNRTKPVNPNTVPQQNARNRFAAASVAWSALTQAQRNAWEAYANQTPVLNKLGESITLSGNSMFTGAYAYAAQFGIALEDAPLTPGVTDFGTNGTGTFDISASTFTTTVTTGTDLILTLAIGPQVSAGVRSFKGPYQVLTKEDGINTGVWVPTFVGVTVPYGALAVGQRRPFRINAASADWKRIRTVYGIATVVP